MNKIFKKMNFKFVSIKRFVLVISISFLSSTYFSQENVESVSRFNESVNTLKILLNEFSSLNQSSVKNEEWQILINNKERDIRIYIGDVILSYNLSKEELVSLSKIVETFDPKLSNKFLVLSEENIINKQ